MNKSNPSVWEWYREQLVKEDMKNIKEALDTEWVNHHKDRDPRQYDAVNCPKHYTNHPSGIECIQITEHMSFTLGNAVKYIWRADLKNGVEDLEKAIWYLQRELVKRKGAA